MVLADGISSVKYLLSPKHAVRRSQVHHFVRLILVLSADLISSMYGLLDEAVAVTSGETSLSQHCSDETEALYPRVLKSDTAPDPPLE